MVNSTCAINTSQAADAADEDQEEELLIEAFQAQVLSSRSQDATSTPASPSSATRKAAEVVVAVEEAVQSEVQAALEASADSATAKQDS